MLPFNNKQIFFAQNIGAGGSECELWEIVLDCYVSGNSKQFTTYDVERFVFNPTGTKMFAIPVALEEVIYEYTLSSAWDISTATYSQQKDFGPSMTSTFIYGLDFNPTGTILLLSTRGDDKISRANLSTAWDISSATYISSSAALTGGFKGNINVRNNGFKVYAISTNDQTIYQFSMSTAYDPTTITYDSISLYVGDLGSTVRSFYMDMDGDKIYADYQVQQYDIGTSFNLSTASKVIGNKYSSASETGGLWFKSDGTMFFRVGQDSNVKQYYFVP
jgi:hypothetical protein